MISLSHVGSAGESLWRVGLLLLYWFRALSPGRPRTDPGPGSMVREWGFAGMLESGLAWHTEPRTYYYFDSVSLAFSWVD